MPGKLQFFVVGLLFLLGPLSLLRAVELLEGGSVVIPDKVSGSQPIKIDGELDEGAWQLPPIAKEFKTFFPNYGDPLAQDTKVWAAYDGKNLYFAFQCLDTEPHKIKTSIAQRDNISRDDRVGILLDAAGSRQTAYEFHVNPNGIQEDAVNSAVSVDGADRSPDFVWESAAKITAQGYQVEVCIPLESIRYRAGKIVKMGVIFSRQISRLGTQGTWPAIRPGQTNFNFMAALLYKDLKGALKLEVLPNFTYNSNKERQDAANWAQETDTGIGVSVKYGITSSITAEATVNPDFSQVESDAFQVEVNQRYPVFYSEKRPFFMESKEVLDFGVVKWGMMPVPIHTRSIVDPGWAGKFSGSSGRLNFAFLAANDRAPGRPTQDGVNPAGGESALFGIVRAKYNIGSDNSLGILYCGRRFAGQSNHAAGADLKYRLSRHLRATFSYLNSTTRDTEAGPLKKGNAWNAMLQYNTPAFFSLAGYERYDPDFFMAAAFLNRVGIDRWLIGAGPRFNMKLKKMPWLKRILPYVYYLRLHDLDTKMDDITGIFGLTLSFAPMGEVNFEYYTEEEAWTGKRFHKNYFVGMGQIQLRKWLLLTGSFIIGDGLYYDPENPMVGSTRTVNAGAAVQPNIKLNIAFDYLYTDLRHKQNSPAGAGIADRRIYSVNIYNFKTTYQFNKYFFLRGILRYNSYREKLMTDFLASFTLIPGTVVHLGYGSLYERNRWEDNRWFFGQGDLLEMRRGLFFKASYLWRID